jgi:glucoamylase
LLLWLTILRYLGTFAAAEQLYDAIFQWKKQGSITVTSTSLPFFKDVYSSAAVGNYASSSATFSSIVNAVSAYADGYMANAVRLCLPGGEKHTDAVQQKYTPQNGALAEQYSRSNGSPLSAVDLTWSYAAFLTAANARRAAMPASWGASAVRVIVEIGEPYTDLLQAALPNSCSGSSATGPCATATSTFSRPTPPTPTCSATPTLTKVLFKEHASTTFGENIYVVGSNAQLGSWNTNNAVALSAQNYTSSNNLWFVAIDLPAGSAFQYKYIRKQSDGSVRWESDPNRSYTVPANCKGEATMNDNWR